LFSSMVEMNALHTSVGMPPGVLSLPAARRFDLSPSLACRFSAFFVVHSPQVL
jgi:hypothetical protein